MRGTRNDPHTAETHRETNRDRHVKILESRRNMKGEKNANRYTIRHPIIDRQADRQTNRQT